MKSDSPGGEVCLRVESHELDNGLRLILQPDPSSPLVSVHVMYHVGSKDEPRGRTGFAHLFEHLLFQGSVHVAGAQHFRYVEDAGGTANGSTWFDRTNYFEALPSHRLDLALWLEADRMGWFLPTITQEKLDTQREVVKNERRQSYENRPYGLAVETMLRTAYPDGHPYRHPTIGYMEDLEAAGLDDVRDFFTTFYGPQNAVLVLAGDFDPADALGRVERFFGSIPGGPEPPRVEIPAPGPGGERRATLEDRVRVPRVYMLFDSPTCLQPDYEASEVTASLLAEGKSSRLYHELVYRRRVAEEVFAWVWPLEKVGMFWIMATARPGVGARELEEALDEAVGRLASEGPDEVEVSGGRNRVRRRLIAGLGSVAGRADAIAHAAVLRGEPYYVNEAFGRYAAIETADIARLAAAILGTENRAVVHVVPSSGP